MKKYKPLVQKKNCSILALQQVVKTKKPIILIWHYLYKNEVNIDLIRQHLRPSIRLFKNVNLWLEGVQLLALVPTTPCGELISNWVAQRFEINQQFRAPISIIKSAYRQWRGSIYSNYSNNLKGFRIEATGRLGNTEIANRLFTQWGTVPRQTLSAGVTLSTAESYTLRGVLGVRILTHY